MVLRHLQYLVALGREQHFARAAAACAVTQPTLSAGIKHLEEDLGVLLVLRGQRFEGFTIEGEQVLRWAQRIVEECASLKQEAARLRGELEGEIRIAAVPTALTLLPGLLDAVATAHPRARLVVHSRSSDEIQRGLQNHEVDAGITYLDNEPIANVRSLPLFTERYLLLLPAAHAPLDATVMPWGEMPELPYCLLPCEMQNRRIIEGQLEAAQVRLEPRIETDSVASLAALLRTGRWASVVPHSLLALLPEEARLTALELVDPVLEHTLGLVVADSDPLTPTAQVLMNVGRALDTGTPWRGLRSERPGSG
jgi:DNA-binding transcriptional LysR family regulator